MEAKSISVEVKKTARIHLLGNDLNPSVIWFVLHGYGHLSTYFIKKFECLNLEKTLIVAPEGLHRFYLSGQSGRVGASWMTKEERLEDIKDYVNYLDDLDENIMKRIHSNPKKVVLGFSQGAATASRWIAKGKVTPDIFVLWASVFPPDMDFESDRIKFNSPRTILVQGNEDEYYTTDHFETHQKELNTYNIHYQTIKYKGKHNIYNEPLIDIQNQLKID